MNELLHNFHQTGKLELELFVGKLSNAAVQQRAYCLTREWAILGIRDGQWLCRKVDDTVCESWCLSDLHQQH